MELAGAGRSMEVPSPGAEQLGVLRQGKALLCLMLWSVGVGLRWLQGSSAMASCFPALLPLHRTF